MGADTSHLEGETGWAGTDWDAAVEFAEHLHAVLVDYTERDCLTVAEWTEAREALIRCLRADIEWDKALAGTIDTTVSVSNTHRGGTT